MSTYGISAHYHCPKKRTFIVTEDSIPQMRIPVSRDAWTRLRARAAHLSSVMGRTVPAREVLDGLLRGAFVATYALASEGEEE
jgi:hypothetical protein